MSAETQSNQHTLSVDQSTAPTSMREALLTWCGYVKFRAAETPQGASPAVFVNGVEHHAHLQQVHTAVEPVRDLGLYFLPQATVSGHCYVFAGDDFVVDGSSPNRIALQWAASEGYLGAANRRQEHLIDLAQPALVVAGPGHNVWGHWLLDFLPRLAIAKQLLGSELTRFRIPVPTDTPDWVFKLASFFGGVDRESFIAYVRGAEVVSCRNGAVMPTYAHSNYFLHSYLRHLYFPFIRNRNRDGPKRFCVSRRRLGGQSMGPGRVFPELDYFEDMAAKCGFERVFPEELGFQEQIDLFAGAEAIVGEYGSGLHNALFSPPDTVIGQFVMPNQIQSRIAGLCGHRMLYLLPDVAPEFDGLNPWEMVVSRGAIDEFFTAVADTLPKKARGSPHSGRSPTPSRMRGTPMERFEVLQPILGLFDAPSYLEIGVHGGDTFFAIAAARKVAVDPNFLFDVDAARLRETRSSFFRVESDRYFGDVIDPVERFEVIYLDGLHSFEQTLRDFCNAVQFLADEGVIVVDDVVPNSYAASLPDEMAAVRLKQELKDADQSWMGDVYRLVFFIDTFFQQYDYATVAENHGQLIVWRRQRSAAELTRRRVEEIAGTPFEEVFSQQHVFRRRAFPEIMESLRRRNTR